MSNPSANPTSSPPEQPSFRVSDLVLVAEDVVRADRRILAVMFVAYLLVAIPYIGYLFTMLGYGVAVVMATKTFEEDTRPENSVCLRLFSLVLADLAATVLIVMGLLLAIVPGIYFAVRFALFPAAVMVDDKGPFEGLASSWARTKGHSLTVFGFMLVIVVPMMLLFGLLLVIFGIRFPARFPLMYTLIASVIGAPFAALSAGGIAVMYDAFDR